MRIKRKKNVRKILKFYELNFGLKAPYKILLDGTFVQACLDSQVQIKEQLPRILGNYQCKLFTTPCVQSEMHKMGPALKGALMICRNLNYYRCHHEQSKTASDCLIDIVENTPNVKFIVATQDKALQRYFLQKYDTPVMFLSGNNPILQEPSVEALNIVKQRELSKRKMSDEEKKKLNIQEKKVIYGKFDEEVKKNPNPLSILKSKKEKTTELPKKKKVRSRRMKPTERE
eukprot:TRINITY_DN3226_c6_g10_i1.p1 TRINITY_DN3226_c6_g10~~TRINITY_DN3226_c6_g10_i1.p1  ORF type:complete len:230 (+),score=65.08 TRINITY_DN3226_c6_g10_i1:182-871(+)